LAVKMTVNTGVGVTVLSLRPQRSRTVPGGAATLAASQTRPRDSYEGREVSERQTEREREREREKEERRKRSKWMTRCSLMLKSAYVLRKRHG